ncbi:hypothetical protein YC2023_066222 [Brassica napus]
MTSVAVRGCPSAHTGRPWLSLCVCVCPFVSVSTHRTYVGVHQHRKDFRVCPPAHTGRLWLSVCVRQHKQDVHGCPSVHISARWSLDSARWTNLWTVRVILAHVGCLFSTHRTSVCPSAHTRRPCVSVSTHRTSVAVRQHIQDICGCPCVSVSTHMTFVAVHQHPYQHVGPWTQHADPSRGLFGTLVLGLSTLTLPVDCSGDFGPRGLSAQYTQDVCGCPPAHTGRPWLSVSVRVCPSVFVTPHRTPTWVVCSVHTGRPWVSASTHRTSVAVRVCPSAYTGRLWLSTSTHISTLVLGLSTLALPVDSLGDFGPRGLSVQYTQDVRECPPAHTGRLWLSVSTHRTSVAVRVCPFVTVSTHRTSVGVRQHTQDVCGFPCVSVSTHRMFVALHQYTYQPYTQHVRGCPPAHTGRLWLFVAVCVCPCVSVSTHTGRLWLSISIHISTLALPVDCSGDFGPRGLSVHYTQEVRRCSSAHTGRPCVSISAHRTSVAVHQYTYQHVGPWTQHADLHVDCSSDFGPCGLSVQYTQDVRGYSACFLSKSVTLAAPTCLLASLKSHESHKLVACLIKTKQSFFKGGKGQQLGISTLGNPVNCLGDVAPRGLSVQYTQDVRGCPPAHTGRPWVSVSTHRTVRVCPSAHISSPWLSVCVRQHTQDVRGYPSVHISGRCSVDTERPWVSASTHRTSVAVRVCPCVSVNTQDVPGLHTGRLWVSVSTHMTFVCVRQHIKDVRSCQCVFPSAHTGHTWLSISTHISTLVLGISTLGHPVDCLGDFGPRGLSVQYTQDVRGCPPAHTGRPWVSVSTHRTSVCVHQHTQDICVCPSAHTGHLCVSVSTHRSSVCVRQHTQVIRVCPSAHTGHPWLSISTHISTLVLGISTLGNPVNCLGDVAPRGLSVQYTQDVRGCPPAHTGRPWVSVSTHRTVRVCPSAHTSSPWLSVCVRQHTQDVRGYPSVHISGRCSVDTERPWVSASTHRTSVAVRVCPCVSVNTQDVPGLHTGRLWVSVSTHMTFVCVRQHIKDVRSCQCVFPSAHTGHTWLSISTHISTLVLGISTLGHPVDCLGDFGPRGLSVQYTQDVRGCPPAHTGRPWVSVIRVCPSAHTRRPWLSIHTHISTLVLGLSMLTLPVDCSGDFCPRGLSVQYKQNVCGCPPAHTGQPWLFVCVRVCPSAHTGRPWLSNSRHISTLVLGLSTLARPVECLVYFGPRGLSVQYTQDIRGCPSTHTGRSCVSVSTHRTSALGHPVDWLGDFGPRGLSVQYTQHVRGCPPAHTGCPWVSVNSHRTSVCVPQHTQVIRGCPCVSVCVRQHTQDVRGCPSVHISARCTHRTSVGVCQHTQDVRGCPSAHTGRQCVSVSTHKSSVAVRVCPSAHTGRLWLYISTHISTLVLGLSTLALPVDCLGDFGPRRLSVQYTQDDVCGCLCVSLCVRLWPSAHSGRTWLFISTHISTLVLGLSMLALPMDCSGDFGPSGLSFQYTQDARGCPSAHIGRSCVSVSTHRTSVAVRVCLCVSVSTHKTSLAVHQYIYHNVGPWTQHTDPSRGLFG